MRQATEELVRNTKPLVELSVVKVTRIGLDKVIDGSESTKLLSQRPPIAGDGRLDSARRDLTKDPDLECSKFFLI